MWNAGITYERWRKVLYVIELISQLSLRLGQNYIGLTSLVTWNPLYFLSAYYVAFRSSCDLASIIPLIRQQRGHYLSVRKCETEINVLYISYYLNVKLNRKRIIFPIPVPPAVQSFWWYVAGAVLSASHLSFVPFMAPRIKAITNGTDKDNVNALWMSGFFLSCCLGSPSSACDCPWEDIESLEHLSSLFLDGPH